MDKPATGSPVCPYRTGAHHTGEGEMAFCRLLADITGVAVDQTPAVSRQSCVGCLALPPAGPASLNGMVASHLFRFTKAIIEQNGVPACRATKAQQLNAWALENLEGYPRTPAPRKRNPPPYLGTCFYLGKRLGDTICRTCRGNVRIKQFECLHDNHVQTDIRHCQTCEDYDLPLPLAPKALQTWAVGVTTAPRRKPNLEDTLHSLRRAGWTDSITLFAEPNAALPSNISKLIVVQRQQTLGAWPNWLLGLSELHLARPHADAYLMIQDDALFVRGLRRYLERNLWPAPRLGVVSLHTPGHQARPNPRGFFRAQVGWGAWGAMAFVFPNAAVRALLHDARVINHRSRGMGDGLKNVDSVIGDWCQRKQLPLFLHSPSLCQHIGLTTTLWSRDSLEGRRAAADFPGESVDINDMMDVVNEQCPKSSITDKPAEGSPSRARTLAIVTVHIGRRHCFPAWKDWICQATRPAPPLHQKPALRIVDNSSDPDFRASHLVPLIEKLRREGSLSHCRLQDGPGAHRSSERLDLARMQSIAKALTRGIEGTGEDLVLIIDDDIVPPPDAIAKLIEAYRKLTNEGHPVGAVSGCYESAMAAGFLVATRPGRGWEARFRVGELEADAIVEAGMVGNGCCLVNGDALRAVLPIEVTLPKLGRVGPDGYLCHRMHQAGLSVWLHGGVVCDHRFREDASIAAQPNAPPDLRISEPGIVFDNP